MADQEDKWDPFVVTDETIADEAKKHKLFVVDCWAEWCAPCKTVSLYLRKLAKQYKGAVVFAKMDMDKNRKSAEKYGISTVPTLLMFYNGKFSDIVLGAMDVKHIRGVVEDMKRRGDAGEIE